MEGFSEKNRVETVARNRCCNMNMFYRILDIADIEKVTHETQKSKKLIGGLFEISIRLETRKT